MTTQDAYEAIREYFARPDATLARVTDSMDVTLCSYRTDDGRKCSVGALIPDEVYEPEMEGKPFGSEWLAENPYMADLLHNVDKDFLRRAQILHDTAAADAHAFVVGLDVLASASGLKVTNDFGRFN